MILVSAGHGPLPDRGAVHEGFGEHEEALIWRDLIVNVCLAHGVQTEAVPAVSLVRKVFHVNERCREAGASIAVEIHFNAGGIPGKTRGCETLYAPRSQRGMRLAAIVQEAMAPFFPPDRGVKEGWYRMDHPHRVDFPGDVPGDEKPDYFLVRTVCPAAILEPDFIYERERIQSQRVPACRAIAEALVKAHDLLCGGGR